MPSKHTNVDSQITARLTQINGAASRNRNTPSSCSGLLINNRVRCSISFHARDIELLLHRNYFAWLFSTQTKQRDVQEICAQTMPAWWAWRRIRLRTSVNVESMESIALRNLCASFTSNCCHSRAVVTPLSTFMINWKWTSLQLFHACWSIHVCSNASSTFRIMNATNRSHTGYKDMLCASIYNLCS